MKKSSAVFGIKNLARYDIGNFMTFGGIAISLIGGAIAIAGHCLECTSIADKQIRFPDDEAVLITNYMYDNCTETKEES